MAGGRARSTRIARALGALVAAAGLATTALLLAPSAGAATDSAQLTLTGLSDNTNPAGGSQLGVHPGDTVQLGASAAPTTQAKTLAAQLGLSSLLTSLLGTVDFQVKADFTRLPGGAANTVLKDGATKSFRFTATGTYYFTWQAEKVTTGLLGTKTELIKFDGNQAKKLGIELNGSNTYVGAIVVATNPPKGGLSIQLPKVSVRPKVGGVQLPKVNVPGVNLPTVPVSVPDLPKSKSTEKKSTPTKRSQPSTSAGTGTVDNQLLPVPARVLGGGTTGGGSGSGASGGGGGYYAGIDGTAPLGNGRSARSGSSSDDGSTDGSRDNADNLASQGPPSAQLPVVLAIIAVVALSLVASLYARLFLLRRNGAG